MGAEGKLFEADTRARSDALDVIRSFIVQAPAGSGKTELLIQRYLCLLSTVDNPEEILAITFTRKAAQEMQLRIAAAMREASRGVTGNLPHEQVTLRAARNALEQDRKKGWDLLNAPRRMRIQTVDALNAAIARSMPFSSGVGGSAAIAADDEMQRLYRAAAAATLDWLVHGSDEMQTSLETVLAHLDNNTGLYVDYLSRMLETRDQWLPIIGPGLKSGRDEQAVRKRLEQDIASYVGRRLERVAALVPAQHAATLVRLADHAARHCPPEYAASGLPLLEGLAGLPGTTPADLPAWRALAYLVLTKSGAWRRGVNKVCGFPAGDEGQREDMQALLESLSDEAVLADELQRVRHLPPAAYSDEQWRVLLALFRLLPIAVSDLKRLFAEQGATDYTEVAMAADAALGNPEAPTDLALVLDYSIRHLLVDEMQDTSYAQYRLIEKLIEGWQSGDGRTLFCVGDPMQSIYRFRNAEVGEFLHARQQGIGAVRLESLLLHRNFRSGEHLVNWFNAVFSRVMPAQDDVEAGAICYAESVPVQRDGYAGVCRVHPVVGSDPELEASTGLTVIRQCLREEEGSVAVLVRSRTQLRVLLAELRRAHIDYQSVEIDRLTDVPEILDVLALTRALCNRNDRTAWLGLLRAPWAGLRWEDLHLLVAGGERRTVWDLLQDDARVAALSRDGADTVRRLRARLAPVLAGHGTRSLRDQVERGWYALGGPRALRDADEAAHVYRYLELLGRFERAGTLPDVAELEARLDRERVSAGIERGSRLQVMTMHKAKGLQFDSVVLFGLGRQPNRGSPSVMSWLDLHDGDGGHELLLSPIGPRAVLEKDALHRMIEARLQDRDRHEQDRLLYVACTRARRSLHLVGHAVPTRDGKSLRPPASGTLLQRLWSSVRRDFEAAFARSGAAPAVDADDSAVYAAPRLRRLEHRLEPLEVPPAPGPQRPPGTREEVAVDYYWVGSVARRAGTIVHRFLQQLAEGRLSGNEAPSRLQSLAALWASELGVPGADLEAVCARAMESLRQVLSHDKGRWLLFGDGHSELSVTGVWNDTIESIVIDRIRIDEEGVHWLVDYKTSTHEGGNLEGFLGQEAERYRPQLAKYAGLYRRLTDAPVRTALYFPLLQEFREVATGD